MITSTIMSKSNALTFFFSEYVLLIVDAWSIMLSKGKSWWWNQCVKTIGTSCLFYMKRDVLFPFYRGLILSFLTAKEEEKRFLNLNPCQWWSLNRPQFLLEAGLKRKFRIPRGDQSSNLLTYFLDLKYRLKQIAQSQKPETKSTSKGFNFLSDQRAERRKEVSVRNENGVQW